MKNILQFCDFLIDRLSEHGVLTGRKPLLVPEPFFLQFNVALKALGIERFSSAFMEMEFMNKMVKGVKLSFSDHHLLYQALRFFRSLMEVIIDFDEKVLEFPSHSILSGLKTTLSWNLDQFVPYAKYVTAYPMAKFLANDLPKIPENFSYHPLLFSGAMKRFLQNRINSRCSRNARLFFGYLQGIKRGCATVPVSYVLQSYVKHRNAMEKEVKTPWDFRSTFSEYSTRFFRNFKETSVNLYEASHSASFGTLKSQGGAKGEIVKDYIGQGISFLVGKNDTELFRMEEIRPGFVEEARSRILPITINDVRNRARMEKNGNDETLLPVMVAAVLEPLKVRLITKGSTWHYYFSKFYQKHLWRYLQQFPQFVLTGRPLQESDLHDLLSREKKIALNLENPFWVSGDYSAATDNINIDLTKDVFNESLRLSGLTEEDKVLLRSVIFQQQINYPEISMIEPVNQMNGQLMGSTLSFPILCIVNLVCYWMALEEYLGKPVKARDLPVLVNGDDIGFRSNKLLYSIWLEKIGFAGFSLSLGKNYIHRDYFTINSQLYKHSVFKGHDRFESLGFYNVGLVQNLQVDSRIRALKPLWDNYNTVMSNCVSKTFTHRRFFHYNYEQIKHLTQNGNINLFISPFLGGLGFNLYDEVKPYIKFTHFQKRLGGFLLHMLKSFQPSELMEDFSYFISRKIALIDPNMRARPKSLITKFHLGRYTVIPAIGPLDSLCRDIIDRSFKTPLMADDDVAESGTLEFQSVPPRIIYAVRREAKALNSMFSTKTRPSRLCSFPYRVVEFIGPVEKTEGASPFISMEQYFE